MNIYKTILICFLCVYSAKSYGQDLHWTMFDMAPLSLNPANTGGYKGTFRLGGIYRSQWNSNAGATGFKTPGIYIDAPILAIGQNSWIGIGGILFQDEAGMNQLTTVGAMGSAAWHFIINQRSNSILTFGVQAGTVTRRLNTNNILLEEQIVIGGQDLAFNSTINGGLLSEQPEQGLVDVNVGVKLFTQLSKKSDMTIGLVTRHITRPEYALLNRSEDKGMPLSLSMHGKFNFSLNKIWTISPAFIYQRMGTANELGLQALAGVLLDDQKGITLRMGPGYRVIDNDAIEFIAQGEFNNLKVGFAYDFNVSALSQVTNNQGGFEVAASYIFKIFKKPLVRPSVLCPKF